MKIKKWKSLIAPLLALLVLLGGSFWALEKMRAGELVRLFAQSLADSTGAAIIVPQNPSVSINRRGLSFGAAAFYIVWRGHNIFVNLEHGEADIDILALGKGNFSVREIRLTRPTVRTDCPYTGKEPWFVAHAGNLPRKPVLVQRVRAQKGEIIWRQGAQNARLEQINISANILNQHETDLSGDFVLAAQFETEISGNLAFRGRLHHYSPNLTFRHASISFTPMTWPLPAISSPLRIGFDGALNMDTLLLRMARMSLGWGEMTLNVRGAAMLEKRSISAEFNLESTGKSKTGSISIQGFMEREAQDLKLEEMDIQAGQNSGSAEISLNFPRENAPPAITGQINFGQVDLDEAPGLLHALFGGLKGGPWPSMDLRIFCKTVRGIFLAGRDMKFELSGQEGSYELRNLRLDTAGGEILANMRFSLPEKHWRLVASGKGLALGGFSLPICGNTPSGAANFALEAKGTDILRPERGFAGFLDLEARNFSCKPAANFISALPANIWKLVSPSLDIKEFSSRMTINENSGILAPLAAKAEKFALSGEAVLDFRPFELRARLEAQTSFGVEQLDFVWPAHYSPEQAQ